MTASTPNRRQLFVVIAALGAASGGLALACNRSDNPGVVIDTGGGPDAGPIHHPDGSVGDDGGSREASGDDGPAPGDDGGGGEASSGADAGPPLCNPDASVGTGTLVLSTADPDEMSGISSDELVIAWTSIAGGGPVVHWAERGAKTDSFGAPQTLDASFGPFPADHVSLSGDGLRLLIVSSDHTTVAEITRAARGAAFDTVGTDTDFRGVNASGSGDGTNPGIGPFGWPTLTPDFRQWAYVQGPNGLTFAKGFGNGTWSAEPFPNGIVVDGGSAASVLEPTGWAADGRTLFFVDPVQGEQLAAWRDPVTSDFYGERNLGSTQQFAFSVPSPDCTKLYYSAQGGDALDIYVAPLQ